LALVYLNRLIIFFVFFVFFVVSIMGWKKMHTIKACFTEKGLIKTRFLSHFIPSK
jgi:hypothetical protein